jgi:hypothetical protein
MLLVSGASDALIEDHLLRIVKERMGLNAKKSDMAANVQALRKITLPQNSS